MTRIPELSPKALGALRALAQQCYKQKDLKKAEQLFQLLTLSDPFEKEHWEGLGHVQQEQNFFRHAIDSWAQAALFDLEDPYPHLHAAECYVSLKNFKQAKKALSVAEECASAKKGEYMDVLSKVRGMRLAWRKKPHDRKD